MDHDDLTRRRNQDLGTLDVALDIGLDQVHLVTDLGAGLVRRQVANRSDELHLMCLWLDRTARAHGFSSVRLIAEPTGIYHELPFSVARRHGFQTRTVQAEAAGHLLTLYDQARLLDRTLPAPQPGVVSKLNLARLVAETGPWSQFASISQLLKFVGLNLFERQSGRWRGKTRISKKGRTLARHVLTQIVVPLVRRNRLLGDFHHHKTKVEKKPGPVAITASARKILNILFGWARSGRAFDPARVFVCQSQIARAA
jgi:transposase